jgi:hypothetical protein
MVENQQQKGKKILKDMMQKEGGNSPDHSC